MIKKTYLKILILIFFIFPSVSFGVTVDRYQVFDIGSVSPYDNNILGVYNVYGNMYVDEVFSDPSVNGYLHFKLISRKSSNCGTFNNYCPFLHFFNTDPTNKTFAEVRATQYSSRSIDTGDSFYGTALIDIQFNDLGYVYSVTDYFTGSVIVSQIQVNLGATYNPNGYIAIGNYRNNAMYDYNNSNKPTNFEVNLDANLSYASLLEGNLSNYSTSGFLGFPYKINGSNVDDSPINPFNIFVPVPDFPDLQADTINFGVPSGSGLSYNNPMTISGNYNNASGYDNVLIYMTGSVSNTYTVLIDPINLTGTFSKTLPTLPLGTYNVMGRLYNSLTYEFGAWFPIESSYPYSFTITDVSVGAVACTTFDIGCHLRSFFVWFFDFKGVFSMFTDMWDSVKTRFPFVYINVVAEAYNSSNIYNDGSSPLDINIPIGNSNLSLFSASALSTNPIASMIRDFLGYAMYILLVFNLYGRLQRLFSQDITYHS